MIRVKATAASRDLSVMISDIGKIADEGEEFEVSEERLEVLLGRNDFDAKFVEIIPEEKPKRKARAAA